MGSSTGFIADRLARYGTNRRPKEKPVRGKRGNPKPGFPLFPPPLEIADDFHIPTGPTHPVYTHQRRPNTSEKCYPCRRAKVLPMSPTVHANTPFHGWGRWGQVETTAMAVSALAKWRKAHGADAAGDALMRRGAMFLLRNSDSSGAWATSQATVRALMALLDLWSGAKDQKASTMRVLINGAQVADVAIPAATEVRGPVSIDASHYVRAGATNQISLVGAAVDAIEVQANAVWYEKWAPKSQSDLRFEVRFNRTEAAVNGEIDCDVAV